MVITDETRIAAEERKKKEEVCDHIQARKANRRFSFCNYEGTGTCGEKKGNQNCCRAEEEKERGARPYQG